MNISKYTKSTPIASGSYTGNSTANRAIPHGLGQLPKCVIIQGQDNTFYTFIIMNTAFIFQVGGGVNAAVTIPDTTNFYVGNAGNYQQSANLNGAVYYWTVY